MSNLIARCRKWIHGRKKETQQQDFYDTFSFIFSPKILEKDYMFEKSLFLDRSKIPDRIKRGIIYSDLLKVRDTLIEYYKEHGVILTPISQDQAETISTDVLGIKTFVTLDESMYLLQFIGIFKKQNGNWVYADQVLNHFPLGEQFHFSYCGSFGDVNTTNSYDYIDDIFFQIN